jgi:hypothetical protein
MPTLPSVTMQSVVDGHLGIKPLDISWQKFPTDGKNGSQWLLRINQCN